MSEILRRYGTAVAVALIAVGFLYAQPAPPEVDALVALVGSASASEPQRTQALADLRTAAAGGLQDARTRDAIFALGRLGAEAGLSPAEAMERMTQAVSLYPDDPRAVETLKSLASAQLEIDQRLAAHWTLLRLLARPDASATPELFAQATLNAVLVEDMASAMDWSHRVDVEALDDELRERTLLVRLESASTLGRHAEAVAALDRLDLLGSTHLRARADALIAAARTEQAVGRHEAAAARFETFVNIHPNHAERPEAMLDLARLQSDLHRANAAGRTYDWLITDYRGSTQADWARLERIEITSASDVSRRALAYREAAHTVDSNEAVEDACRRLLELLLTDGRPLDAVAELSRMVRESPPVVKVAAIRQLTRGAEPAVGLLVDREDWVGLLAAVAQLESSKIPLPASLTASVATARQRLGLETRDEQVEAATAMALEGRWSDVVPALDRPTRAADPQGPGAIRARLRSEALWRDGDDASALALLDAALSSTAPPDQERPLLVLRADVRFSAGDRPAACQDYRKAVGLARSSWVEHQLTHCPPNDGDGGDD
ncbi:MAG: hypothetical protein GY716_08625 [bacterium]|nr:hypothetical protein [bacterium]